MVLAAFYYILAKTMSRDHATLRQQVLRSAGNPEGFITLFGHLDRVAFFLKDRAFRVVAANRYFYERLGFSNESDIIGKEDFELFPRPLAAKFRRDDEQVLRTGEGMPEMVELFLSRQGLPDWFITTKLPLAGKDGRPIGVMGTVQRFDQSRGLTSSDTAVSRAVERMLERPGEIDSLSELASELGLSHRHFDRRFKEDTGLTPKQFLHRSRVQAGCRTLRETDRPIAEIAVTLGYCDQSAFTSQFRKRMGITPSKYRKEFGRGRHRA